MGCGCGGNNAMKARRAVRSAIATNEGVLSGLAAQNPQVNLQALKDERRRLEKLRRDTLLRALARPQ